MTIGKWFGSQKATAPGSLWSRKAIAAALAKRYREVDDLGEESGFAVYGVTDGEVRFAVVLALVEGVKDKVSEVGFLARFSGFNLTPAQLDSVNRNLHISVASFHTDGDLYLIGGVQAAGAFSENTFLLICEAWKRDLIVIIQSMSLSHTLAGIHPAAGLQSVQRFVVNRAPGGDGASIDERGASLFAAFAGGAASRLSLCATCGGRGKIGFLARGCEECEGEGLVPRRR